MKQFTVVTYYTPDFECFIKGLQEDCQTLGYPLYSERLASRFDNVIQAFDYKIEYIQQMVERFGRVLWLDVECRIVQPIPAAWTSPLISTYSAGESMGFSSGVLMLDDSQSEFIALWLKYARKYPRYPDDFVLDFLSHRISYDFMTVPLEFYDRETTCPVARGLWKNEHTIIQHPTINRWPEPTKYRQAFSGKERKRRSQSEAISRQRKGVFYRNFGGDFAEVQAIMQAGRETEYRNAGWVFDSAQQLYAPELYWPDIVDDYCSKPRSFEKSWENFTQRPKGSTFRTAAIQRMQLDTGDAKRFGPAKSRNWLNRARSFFEPHG